MIKLMKSFDTKDLKDNRKFESSHRKHSELEEHPIGKFPRRFVADPVLQSLPFINADLRGVVRILRTHASTEVGRTATLVLSN